MFMEIELKPSAQRLIVFDCWNWSLTEKTCEIKLEIVMILGRNAVGDHSSQYVLLIAYLDFQIASHMQENISWSNGNAYL